MKEKIALYEKMIENYDTIIENKDRIVSCEQISVPVNK